MNSLKWHNVGALISFSTDKLSRLNTHNWVKNLWTWMLAPRLTIERTLHIMQSVTLRKWAFLCSKTVCVMSTNFCNPSFMMWYWGSLVMNQLHFIVYQTPRAINNAGQTSRFTTNTISTKQNWQTIYRNWSQREFNSLVFKWMTLKPSKYCFLL